LACLEALSKGLSTIGVSKWSRQRKEVEYLKHQEQEGERLARLTNQSPQLFRGGGIITLFLLNKASLALIEQNIPCPLIEICYDDTTLKSSQME